MEEKKEIQQEETTTIDPEEKRKETHILTLEEAYADIDTIGFSIDGEPVFLSHFI